MDIIAILIVITSIIGLVIFFNLLRNSSIDTERKKKENKYLAVNQKGKYKSIGEQFDKLLSNVGSLESSITILDYPSYYEDETIGIMYTNYYSKLEKVVSKKKNIAYKRIFQIPNYAYNKFPKDKPQQIRLMLSHLSPYALSHIINMFKHNKDNFMLYIIPTIKPFAVMLIDGERILHKMDKYNEGVPEFHELYINTSLKVIKYNSNLIDTRIEKIEPISQDNLLEVLTLMKVEKEKKIVESKEKVNSYQEKIDSFFDQQSNLMKRSIKIIDESESTNIENSIKEKQINLRKLEEKMSRNVTQLEKIKNEISNSEKELEKIKEKIYLIEKSSLKDSFLLNH